MKPRWPEVVLLVSAVAALLFMVASFALHGLDLQLTHIAEASGWVALVAYLLTFLFSFYYFFATPDVTEFRTGWLLLLLIGTLFWFLPFLVFPYWYYTIRKNRPTVAQQGAPGDGPRPAGSARA